MALCEPRPRMSVAAADVARKVSRRPRHLRRKIVPGAGEVAERFRDDDPGFVGEPVQQRVVRVLRAQRLETF